MPQGFNNFIYNPGVSVSIPEYLLAFTLTFVVPEGTIFFQ